MGQEKPAMSHFLERVIKLLLSRAGQVRQSKFTLYKHVGLSLLNKIWLNIAKFGLATSHPDNMVTVFRDAPLKAPAGSDTASVVKLMKYFLDDLDHAIVTTAIGVFSEVP